MVAMSRRIIIASVVTGVIVVGAAAGGFAFIRHGEQIRLDKDARTAADRFAGAWSHRDLLKMGYAGRTANEVAASFKTTTAGLGSAPVKVTVTSLTRDGDRATGKLSVAWTVAEGSTWAYTMPISLQRNDVELWDVVARDGATMWAPDVDAKAKLVAARTWGKRGEVLGRGGSPILAVGKVYDVAIDPARASAQTVAELEKLVNEPASSLAAKLSAAKTSGSKAPIPVVAYREADFQARRTRAWKSASR